LVHCSHVEHVTIVLRDLIVSPIPSFAPLLGSMWSSLGPRLRKLTVHVTLAKLWLVLDPAITREFRSLVEFEIFLDGSRFRPPRGAIIEDRLVPFTRSLSGTLESLLVSSSMVVNMNSFFGGIDRLPKLRKLVISDVLPFVVFGENSTQEPSSLAPFIVRHRKTLEHLTVRIHHSLPQPFIDEKWMQFGSPDLYFTRLQTFELGGLSSQRIREEDWRSNILYFPSIPCLETLTIFDKALSWDDINALLSVLIRAGTGDQLRRMSLKVEKLNAQLIDLLATKLPHLKELDLTFGEHGSEHASGNYQRWRWTYNQAVFRDEMQPRKYPHWMLQHLRLATPPASQGSQCCYGHADVLSMEIVAESLPSRPTFELRNDDDCFC